MSVKAQKVDFEDALEMTGFGKFNLGLMVVVGSVVVSMAFETSSVAYLVPASACELGTNSAQQGLMAGMPLFGILAASNVWGYLADTRGRRKAIFAALILGFITGCSATFSPNWIVFCFFKFLSASSMAGTFALANTYISECTPAAKRATFIVLVTSIFTITVGVMAALTIPILPLTFSFYIPSLGIYFNSWRLLNIIFSIPCAFSAVLVYFTNESPKFILRAGNEREALRILKQMYVINTGNDEDSFKVSSLVLDEDNLAATSGGFWRSVINQTVPLMKPPLLKNTLLLTALYITVHFTVTPYTVWTPLIVDGFMKSLERGETDLTICQMLRSQPDNETVDVKQNDCTLNHTAMIAVFTIDVLLAACNIMMTFLLACVGKKKMLMSLQILAGVSALFVNFSSIWILTAVLLYIFIMAILNFGLLNSFCVDMFPTYVKAMGSCLTLMIARGSAVFGINLLKNLLTNNCEASFYVFGTISIIGAFFGLFLPADKKVPQNSIEIIKD